MSLEVVIPFTFAMAAYIVAGGLGLAALRLETPRLLDYGKHLAAVGNTLLLVVFAVRWWKTGLIPLTGVADSLNLFLILITGIIMLVQRNEAMRPLLSFYLPAVGILAILTGVAGYRFLDRPPIALNGLLLTLHVGLVFLAMSMFFVASLTSMAYAYQANSLKRRKTGGLSQRLPSLERLEHSLFRLIGVGYPIFIATIVVGAIWTATSQEALTFAWFLQPKIVFSMATVVFFAASYYVRKKGLLRGPKLAYLLFFGFIALLATWIALELMRAGMRTTGGMMT